MFPTLSAINDQLFATPVVASAVESVWKFFAVGGPFMLAIIACSLVALAVIVFKFRTLTRNRIVPEKLAGEVERLEDLLGAESLGDLEREFRGGHTTLARLCAVALRKSGLPKSEVQVVVEATAREEVVKMNSGMPVLEVIINIAPLLGLLGTASGLALVFRDLGATANHAEIARGIFMALSTTIVGLAVAVPSVIAHSHFSRKIEMMAVRLEVLLSHVITATHAKGATPPPAIDPVAQV